MRKRSSPPRVPGGARGIEGDDRRVVPFKKVAIVGSGLQLVRRNDPQHADGVVRRRPPERVIEPAKDNAPLGMPAPPEVDREFFEAGEAFREYGPIEESGHWSHAPTSEAKRDRSMLPPETTATVLPDPDRASSAAAIAQPAAPSAITCMRSATNAIARATSSRETTIDPDSPRSSGHIVGITDLPPAPSTNDAFQRSKYMGRPSASDAASGAAVSGSAAYTFVVGFKARMAAEMPDSRPPPPSGATIASTSGRSSRISRPMVPLPAMKRSSSKGWTRSPAIRSDPCVSTVVQHSSYVARTIEAPRRSIARILVSGAVSMTITEQRAPTCRAAYATPCAALPALTVHTPPASSSAVNWRIALYAPRILKDPIGCNTSSFK